MKYFADLRLDRRSTPTTHHHFELEADSATEAVRQLTAFQHGFSMAEPDGTFVLERLAAKPTRKMEYRRIS